MQVQAYLERINDEGDLAPTAANLKRIHAAHLYTVPFENLDIHLGRKITLDKKRIYQKIVVNKRGGFCYEVNGLFGWLLQELGYNVTLLSARSIGAEGVLGIEYDHLMLLVKCPADLGELADIPWLVDIGWGDNFHNPKRLDQIRIEQDDGLRKYKIEATDNQFYELSQQSYAGEWEKQYRFNLKAHAFEDYTNGCHHQQTSPDSHFTQKRVCTIATPAGRKTLGEDKLIVTIDGEKQTRQVRPEDRAEILIDHFGIDLELQVDDALLE